MKGQARKWPGRAPFHLSLAKNIAVTVEVIIFTIQYNALFQNNVQIHSV